MPYQAVLPSAAVYYMSNPSAVGPHGIADGPGAYLAGISPNYLGNASMGPRGLQYYSNVGLTRATGQGSSVPVRIGPIAGVAPAFASTSPY